MEYDVFDVMCPNCRQTKFGVLLKPNTLSRIKCPKCKSTTYVYVSENLDILTFGEDDICDECGGSGRCPECDGTGEVLCSKCKGDGWLVFVDGVGSFRLEEVENEIYFDEVYDFYIRGCLKCGGFGAYYVISDYYAKFLENLPINIEEKIKKGKGKIKCEKCNGTGVCPKCKGLRFLPGKKLKRK